MLIYGGMRVKNNIHHLILKDTDRDVEIGIPIEEPAARRIVKYLDTILPPHKEETVKDKPSE